MDFNWCPLFYNKLAESYLVFRIAPVICVTQARPWVSLAGIRLALRFIKPGLMSTIDSQKFI